MRRGGGLYGHFVSSSDEDNRPYRGAEIPPPSNLSHYRSGSTNKVQGNLPGYTDLSKFKTPSASGVNKQGYSTINAIAAGQQVVTHQGQYLPYSSSTSDGLEIKKARTEEEYWDEEEEEASNKTKENEDLLYTPAPGSPGKESKGDTKSDSDSEEDPLDAFMANLEKDAKTQGVKNAKDELKVKSSSSKNVHAQFQASSKNDTKKGIRTDIEEADDEESYYKWLEENPNAGKLNVDEDGIEIEYDEDGNPIAPVKSKDIDPLPPINHEEISYKPFKRNFYIEHTDILGLSPVQVIDLQQKLGIRVAGAVPPKPVSSFAHFGFDEVLMKAIRKSEFSQPTPIQAQAIPAVLSGRDVIGIAKTGSGKTAAFLWPMLVHIVDQRQLLKGEGPIGLILVPTRELAMQIYTEAKRFGKVFDLEVVCAYGGGSKYEQSKSFESGAEIAIATPGRMIDMIKMKVTNLQRVTYLVLDEADRMFDMGFEPQVRSICDHARPDRQCMLFSATFKRKIERLARDALVDPVKIVQGSVGEASEDVTQIVRVVGLGGYKWNWLSSHLVEFTSEGAVLIFVTKKQNCEELAANLKSKLEIDLRCIHGDLIQHERNEIIHAFKKKEFPILVATDVAARGLDIPHIRTVINFDVARDIDTHTHRVGRTGRAGVKGTAYTLVTEKDKEFVGHIVRNLEAANQNVSKELMELAMKSSWFKNSRFKRGSKNFKGGPDRIGLGFEEPNSKSSKMGSQDPLPEYLTSNSSITTRTDTTGNTTSSGGVIGSGRLNAVRTAFKNQYMSRFCAASTDGGKMDEKPLQETEQNRDQQMNSSQFSTTGGMPPPRIPPSPQFHSSQENISESENGDRKERKRKSRWDDS